MPSTPKLGDGGRVVGGVKVVGQAETHHKSYALRYIRAAMEGGVELGIRADDAKHIVMQTLRGAVDVLAASDAHPEAEIDKVTTPGGLTIKGLNAMEAAGFTHSVIEGLRASTKR